MVFKIGGTSFCKVSNRTMGFFPFVGSFRASDILLSNDNAFHWLKIKQIPLLEKIPEIPDISELTS